MELRFSLTVVVLPAAIEYEPEAIVSTFVTFFGRLGFGLLLAATATTLEPCVVTCEVSVALPLHVWVGSPWQEIVSDTVVGVVDVDVSDAPSGGETVIAPLADDTVAATRGYVAISSHEMWWPTSAVGTVRVWAVAPEIKLPSSSQRYPSNPKLKPGCCPAQLDHVAA